MWYQSHQSSPSSQSYIIELPEVFSSMEKCLLHQALRLGDLLLELRLVSRSSETSRSSGTSQSFISSCPAFPDAVAGVTPCHIAGNIAGDAWPPVIAGNQLQCLPPPWVASHHRVMVGVDNVVAELGVFWDIHASPVHDQVSISLPLVQSKHACSKLSEGFDYCIVIVCTSPDVFHQLVASTIH